MIRSLFSEVADRSVPWLSSVVLLAGLLFGAGACSHQEGPARDHIKFSHGSHMVLGASCLVCHGEAASPDAGTGAVGRPLMPAEDTCKGCHMEGEQAACTYCHTDPAHPSTYMPSDRDTRWRHSTHQAPQRGQCQRCHRSVGSEETVAGYRPDVPDMATCLGSCHQQQVRSFDCAYCHRDLSRFRMDQVSSVDHGSGWVRRHGRHARQDANLCTQCHEPTFCSDCHEASVGAPLELREPMRVYRDFVHRDDFLSRHPEEARLERGMCARCHGVSYCDDCHRQRGIGGSVAPGSPHPPGWLDPTSANGHARSARRDITLCAACHESDADTLCAACHRVGGPAGINPHPPGFAAGRDPLAHAVCRVCHLR
ncbi:MAG: cytochrome c3 family protein [Deltaproteobacteria bacterium]|nr:cytochrome c3 family protein [Deltaproteobacteria bacterium]